MVSYKENKVLCVQTQELYSQYFIFFVPYKCYEYASV
jgi:hypothetical protein